MIQHVQRSMVEVPEEQAKDKVWRQVIIWVAQVCVLEKKKTRGKAKEVLVAHSMLEMRKQSSLQKSN